MTGESEAESAEGSLRAFRDGEVAGFAFRFRGQRPSRSMTARTATPASSAPTIESTSTDYQGK